MSKAFKKLRDGITPEQEILRNRLLMGFPAGVSCYFLAFDAVIISAFAVYLLSNAVLFVLQRYHLGRAEGRWFAGILLDVLMAFSVMLREPEHMSIFYPILLWMILGNGFRFGLKWLFVAASLATVAFGTIVWTTAYWQPNQTLGYGLTAALFVIPAYCSTLIRRISYAKDQAEMASRAKSYFLASVSHELRTPLNAIIGYGNHLRQVDMPRRHKEMIEASVLAGEHLLNLIEQLIEVAKSGAGSAEIKKTTFQPTELLTEVRAIMSVRAEEKGLTLQLQAEPLSDAILNGPGDVLRNILVNLTGNAVKFTESGTISISSGLTETSGKHTVWFAVSDTGIGIADNSIDLIFQPFQQADETVMNRFGGTGLGLAICKQLVEQVNGTISVSSLIGKGSIFRIEVPVELTNISQSSGSAETAQPVQILSFGNMAPAMLASAQSLDNVVVRHIHCDSPTEMAMAMVGIDLGGFDVALIAEELAQRVEPESPIWQDFAEAEVAPVLVKGNQTVNIEDVHLRAAFASVLPQTPSFSEIRSAIRIGCSFAHHLRLPHTDEAPLKQALQSRRVLVADDNRTNRNVLGAILESAGHVVSMVTDGDEALEALERSSFDILLLDVNMPRLNGIDACAMWRQIEGGRQHLPIIGVTADATSETEIRCRNAGMDLRITKPIDAKLLLTKIEQFCSGTAVGELNAAPSAPDPLNVVVPISGAVSHPPDAIDQGQIEYLMSIGDFSFVSSMIEGFFEDVGQTLEPLRQAAASNDVRAFRFCAHAFKSSGNNMGAKQLAALCSKLEKVTEPDFAEYRYAYLEKIEVELGRATEALNALLESSYPPAMLNQR